MHKPKQQPTILVVDDEGINVMLIHDALKDFCRVIGVVSGKQALQAVIKEPHPDLILLDVLMPEMDGYAVCQAIKKNRLTADIPVIFITALEEEEDETKGFAAGAVDYIHKPIRKAILRARVKIHLELKKERDFHARQALIDGLTGIANRRRFEEHLEVEMRRAHRNKSPIALIMLDIDFFKLFNDNYGHIAGDECLKQVASAVHGCMHRSHDLAARFGGEEFICVLPDTDKTGAQEMSKAILQAVRDLEIPHNFSRCEKILTVSIGCFTIVPSQGESIDDLVREADDLLYYSKQEGRNRATCKAM